MWHARFWSEDPPSSPVFGQGWYDHGSDSAIASDKWLTAIWIQTSMKNGVSSWEIHRSLGITQKCAWHMLHRIRLALQDPNSGGKFTGEVEADETYIGAKARNMHKSKRDRVITGRGNSGKTGVMGIWRGGWKTTIRQGRSWTKKEVSERSPKMFKLVLGSIPISCPSYVGLDEFEHRL